jgi:UDP-glucose 4-epimerase
LILITGGLGFIGAHTTRAFLDAGHSCVVTRHRNASVPAFIGDRATVETSDLTDRLAVLALGDRHAIDGIVHIAAVKPFTLPVEDELGRNVAMLVNVLAAARAWGVRRVTVASTIGVYLGAPGNPLREDAALPMTGRHGIQAAKKCYEIVGSAFGAASDAEVVSARIGAIWGPLGNPSAVFFPAAAMVHAAVRGEPPVYDPPSTAAYADDGIDMCYVSDCARALVCLQTAPALRWPVYNVGSGRVTTNAEVQAAIADAIPGAPADLPAGHNPRRRTGNLFLDVSRLTTDTGFRPEYDARRGVAEYVDWLRAGNAR